MESIRYMYYIMYKSLPFKRLPYTILPAAKIKKCQYLVLKNVYLPIEYLYEIPRRVYCKFKSEKKCILFIERSHT